MLAVSRNSGYSYTHTSKKMLAVLRNLGCLMPHEEEEEMIFSLFLGQENKKTWKMFNERQSITQLTLSQVARMYKGTVIYPWASTIGI